MSALAPLRHLHHVALVTTRLEASREFYRAVLGFREMPRPPFSFRGAWLYGAGVQIHLIEDAATFRPPHEVIHPRAAHLAFSIDATEPFKARLNEHNVAFLEQVNTAGVRQIFFHDPDGYQLEAAVYPDPAVDIVAN